MGTTSVAPASHRSARSRAVADGSREEDAVPSLEESAHRFEHTRLPLGAHARERRELVLLARVRELAERLHAGVLPERPHHPRPEPGHVEEAPHRLGDLRSGPVERGERPGVHGRIDLRRDRLPHPGERLELSARGDDGERLGVLARGLGEAPVRARLERVVAADLEEIGELGEEVRDGSIVHDSIGLSRRPRAVFARSPRSARSGARLARGARSPYRRGAWCPPRQGGDVVLMEKRGHLGHRAYTRPCHA